MKKTTYLLLGIIFGVLLCTSFTNMRGQATEFSFGLGFDYLFFKSVGGYYALNGTYCYIEYWSENDAWEIVQPAIQSLERRGGGRLHFASGTFRFSQGPLYNSSDILTTGNGESTILKLKTLGSFIQVGDGIQLLSSVSFEDLQIEGQKMMIGITYNKTKSSYLDNVVMKTFNKVDSVNLLITTSDRWVSYLKIFNCKFTGQTCIEVIGTSGVNALKIYISELSLSGDKEDTVGMKLSNLDTSVIRDNCVSGFETGIKMINYTNKNVFSMTRCENNDVDYYIDETCQYNRIELMPKFGEYIIEDYGLETVIIQ